MRNRLIELLKSSGTAPLSPEMDWEQMREAIYGHIADHLLANGVIVPPCKVGDTVWLVWTTTNSRLEIVRQDVVRGKVRSVEIDESGDICFQTERSCFYAEHIGRKVFFTKEEAEQALKEREQSA